MFQYGLCYHLLVHAGPSTTARVNLHTQTKASSTKLCPVRRPWTSGVTSYFSSRSTSSSTTMRRSDPRVRCASRRNSAVVAVVVVAAVVAKDRRAPKSHSRPRRFRKKRTLIGAQLTAKFTCIGICMRPCLYILTHSHKYTHSHMHSHSHSHP